MKTTSRLNLIALLTKLKSVLDSKANETEIANFITSSPDGEVTSEEYKDDPTSHPTVSWVNANTLDTQPSTLDLSNEKAPTF